MIKEFTYRTELGKREISQTIFAKSLEESVENWIDHIIDFKNEVNSFDHKSVESIQIQFGKGSIELQKKDKVLVYKLNGKYQTTYINEEKKIEPDFVAEFKFFTTENGGRKGYVNSGYRPIFKLTGKKEMTSAKLIFEHNKRVFPGDKVIALINILWTQTFENTLYADLEFELIEPPKVIGLGKIIEVANKKLKKASR